jgi:protein CpxP
MRYGFRTLAFNSALCLTMVSGTALLAPTLFAPTLLAQDTTQDQGTNGGMQQGYRHGPMSPDQELEHMTKALDLTSDQQTQIKPILQDRHDQMMQLHQDQSMARPDKMAKMQALDQSSNSKLEAVLTDQQKTKYEAMIQRREQHMHGGGYGQGQGGDAQPQ